MKTLKSLTTAVLILVSISTFAKVEVSSAKTKIPAPAFTWGSPEDLNLQEVALLKNHSAKVMAPEFVWGSPADLNEADLQALKVNTHADLALPAFNWGTPEDLDQAETLKLQNRITIQLPAIVIGDAGEIDASGLK